MDKAPLLRSQVNAIVLRDREHMPNAHVWEVLC